MKNSIRIVLGALALGVAAYTNSANATLISSGMADDQNLLIYDSVNNVTWYDSVYIDTAANLKSSPPTVTINGVGTTGWTLPTITQLTALSGELGSNPANWGPFETLPQYSTDSFVSTTTGSKGFLDRENLITGFISIGTANTQYGDGLYEVAGRVANAGQPSVPDGGATALLLGMSLGGLHLLRRRI